MAHYGMRTLTLVVTAFLYGCRTAAPVPGPPLDRGMGPASIDSLAEGGRVYLHTEVDTPAWAIEGRAFPRYPTNLRDQGIQGRVQIRFVVDTMGGVVLSSARVLSSTHPDFSAAVLKVLPQLRFTPAVLAGRRVRMWAIQDFEFRLGAH